MQAFVLPYLISLPVLAGLDLLWLGVVMKDFYRSSIGHLLAPSVGWGATIAFYLVFALGMFVFAVAPAAAKGSLQSALMLGALFGFSAYAAYDLTNLATLKDWPLALTVVDILWGTALGGILGAVGYLLTAFFNK